ncbi:biotin--[acetyl-CoA-carboxylase] ligase [Candidatus Palibaumannia cicadellinicola]|uniref:Biotin-[acetyl-CoA-carboxylase] ligase n=1 Tax=Baumannia cicadellinicola subsp. Homalodisca coagulata TaxID=374463 RepID=Q1LSX4_BAUCH|nr:biotin--[acetyl-CoA-carboxylase] ligase [Candidatus Baumannia cicadellinicola]ABF14181.1 biotin-[acetyl-CoA-carboxylase] ligase [Baumannia cicadellinicola str. Hc (Homalodisca coagulata)]
MNKITGPLNIIRIISDGNIYSIEHLCDLLHINTLVINQYIKIIHEWGINLCAIQQKNNNYSFYLKKPLYLLDEQIIQAMLIKGSIRVLPVINSTNQYLIDNLKKLQSGDACVAEYQFNGRGTRGSRWISPFGYNLYYSIYWRFEHIQLSSLIHISLIVSIAVAEMLQTLGAHNIQVKWPNDLYFDKRKLAGILVEITSDNRNLTHVVIGVGINLNMPLIVKKWINLQELGIHIMRNILTAKLTQVLHNALILFEHEGLAPFILRWSQFNPTNQPLRRDRPIF